MVNKLKIKSLELKVEEHLAMLNNPPEGITDVYRKYFVSYHLNEVEKLEQEIADEYER